MINRHSGSIHGSFAAVFPAEKGRRRRTWKLTCALIALWTATAVSMHGQTFSDIVNFTSANGSLPTGRLIQGSDGNLYGTAAGGGTTNSGTAFKLTASGAVTTLHSFGSTNTDGVVPQNGLVQATDGNFYGTTTVGGTKNNGTIFSISLGGAFKVLYNFADSDGSQPGELMQASDGNLYGTTATSLSGAATAFKITLGGALTTLYKFPLNTASTAGIGPSRLIQGSDGNFYGTTSGLGLLATGTVFKMTPAGAVTYLHAFAPQTEGYNPIGGLVQGADGNFYGTNFLGGTSANIGGTAFQVSPCGPVTILHSFSGPDGRAPLGLVQASNGEFYGLTETGGSGNFGTAFSVSLASTNLPAINQCNGVVNGASFQPTIAPNSWITISGSGLASTTDTWNNAIVGNNLPASLDGVSVSVGGQPAYISYVSPTQINALVGNVAPGTVPVTVSNSSGISPAVNAVVQATQPAFFQWGTYAVATRQDYSLAVKNGTFSGLTTVPAKPGDVIILWGSGFGATSPSAPVGMVTPSTTAYNTANPVTVTVGGIAATVYGAALASGYAGLYQVAIQVPAVLANGDYPVVATVSGAQSPSTVLITVQN